MTAGERFDLAMQNIFGYERYGADLGRKYNISTQAANQYKKKNQMTKKMKIIAENEGISIIWIEHGIGQMFTADIRYDAIKNRIMKALNMVTLADIGEELDIPMEKLLEWDSQKEIPEGEIMQIANQIGVDPHWLEFGENSQRKALVEPDSASEKEGADTVSLPYFPDIYAAAGAGGYADLTGTSPVTFSRQFIESYLGLHLSKGMHIINISGDSMEPDLHNGDLAFINPIENEGFIEGEIYAIMYEGTLLVKKVRRHPIKKTIKLISSNPEVEDVDMTTEESEACILVGRVVGSLGKM